MKKFLALVLAIVMVASMAVSAFAIDGIPTYDGNYDEGPGKNSGEINASKHELIRAGLAGDGVNDLHTFVVPGVKDDAIPTIDGKLQDSEGYKDIDGFEDYLYIGANMGYYTSDEFNAWYDEVKSMPLTMKYAWNGNYVYFYIEYEVSEYICNANSAVDLWKWNCIQLGIADKDAVKAGERSETLYGINSFTEVPMSGMVAGPYLPKANEDYSGNFVKGDNGVTKVVHEIRVDVCEALGVSEAPQEGDMIKACIVIMNCNNGSYSGQKFISFGHGLTGQESAKYPQHFVNLTLGGISDGGNNDDEEIVVPEIPEISEPTPDSPILSVSQTMGVAGNTVDVTIDLSQNSGLASLKFDVLYDEFLTLKKVEFASGIDAQVTTPEPYGNPQTLSIISPIKDMTYNGTIATLTFEISENVKDNYPAFIEIVYNYKDIFDGEFNIVPINVENGCITVFRGLPGDIDGNGEVNNADAILLFRYVAGWNVEVDLDAIDTNGDGEANNMDVIILFRYVAGWEGITLHRGTLCAHEESNYWIVDTPADVGIEGKRHTECIYCGEIMNTDIIPALPKDVDTSEHYTPTVGGLQVKGGVEYGWGDYELTLDFTDSKIVKVKVDTLDASLQEALADEDLFANRVLQLAGADTFVLPEFTAENGNFFKDVYTYTISLNYYVAAGSFKIVAINGDVTRDIVSDINVNGNTITFDYFPALGDTAIAFVTEGDDAEIYLGRMTFFLYTFGPSYNQLVEGYAFDWAKFDAMQIGGNRIQVKDIEDETIRNNIKATGYEDDDYIIANAGNGAEGTTGGNVAFVWHPDHFTPGRKYIVTYTYYSTSGTGGYFLALNGSPQNHLVSSGVIAKAGQVDTKTFKWEVGEGECASIWYMLPNDLYMLDITVQLDLSPEYHYNRDDIHSVTAEELAAGYTFDFSEGNIPATGKWYIDVENLSEDLQAVLTADNGFGTTVAHIENNPFRFGESVYGVFTTGKAYTLTMRVWADENLFGGMILLPFNSYDYQDIGSDVVYDVISTPVDGVANVYDVSYTFTVEADTTMYYGFYIYGPVASNIYVGSITFAPYHSSQTAIEDINAKIDALWTYSEGKIDTDDGEALNEINAAIVEFDAEYGLYNYIEHLNLEEYTIMQTRYDELIDWAAEIDEMIVDLVAEIGDEMDISDDQLALIRDVMTEVRGDAISEDYDARDGFLLCNNYIISPIKGWDTYLYYEWLVAKISFDDEKNNAKITLNEYANDLAKVFPCAQMNADNARLLHYAREYIDNINFASFEIYLDALFYLNDYVNGVRVDMCENFSKYSFGDTQLDAVADIEAKKAELTDEKYASVVALADDYIAELQAIAPVLDDENIEYPWISALDALNTKLYEALTAIDLAKAKIDAKLEILAYAKDYLKDGANSIFDGTESNYSDIDAAVIAVANGTYADIDAVEDITGIDAAILAARGEVDVEVYNQRLELDKVDVQIRVITIAKNAKIFADDDTGFAIDYIAIGDLANQTVTDAYAVNIVVDTDHSTETTLDDTVSGAYSIAFDKLQDIETEFYNQDVLKLYFELVSP